MLNCLQIQLLDHGIRFGQCWGLFSFQHSVGAAFVLASSAFFFNRFNTINQYFFRTASCFFDKSSTNPIAVLSESLVPIISRRSTRALVILTQASGSRRASVKTLRRAFARTSYSTNTPVMVLAASLVCSLARRCCSRKIPTRYRHGLSL